MAYIQLLALHTFSYHQPLVLPVKAQMLMRHYKGFLD